VYGRHHVLDVIAGVVFGMLEYHLHVSSLWVPAATAAAWQVAVAAPVLPWLASRLGSEL
jgi:hypothetical protein